MNQNLFRRTGDEDFSNFIKALIAGAPKSGKTRLLGTVPGIFICDTEPDANNLQTIRHLDLPYAEIRRTQDLRDVALILGDNALRKQLAQQRYGLEDIAAVGIDTMDTLQKLMKKERMEERRSRSWDRDDWGWLKTEMEAIIELFTSLPLHVFFTVHLKTQEIGKGVDAYAQYLPGMEGAIANSIAGMVGYSLLTFREEQVDPTTNAISTKYYIRTEGDKAYDFLGTRVGVAGLPTVIEPDMATIHNVIQAGKQAVLDARARRVELPPMQPMVVPGQVVPQAPHGVPQAVQQPPAQQQQAPAPQQEVAQNPSQPQQVQTPVQTPEQPVGPPAQASPAAPAGDRPADDEPVNVNALTHLRRIYEALQIEFPEAMWQTKTVGDARNVATMWRGIQQDHAEGKAPAGSTPPAEMLLFLQGAGLVSQEPATPAPAADPVMETLDINANLTAIKAYIGTPPNLARVQEVYDAESAKDKPRTSLVSKLLDLGAKPPEASAPPVEPDPWAPPEGAAPAAAPVQTPVENQPAPPQAPVTPPAPQADTPAESPEQLLERELGAQVESTSISEGVPCVDCGNPIDDVDLAELGQKRFDGAILCVKDYLARSKQP